MASTDASDFRLSVLNPGGRDLEQYFDEPVGPTGIGHPPINLHAFAACTRGSFHRATKNAIAEKRPILLLLRGNFRATERALAECQKEKRTVAVNEQSGIFIGTREWDVPSRNHLATLLLAREICADTEESVTVFNLDGRRGEKLLTELKFPPGKLLAHEKRDHTAITCARWHGTKLSSNSIAAASRDKWRGTRFFAGRFALVAMAQLSGSHLPIFAGKAGPRRKSRLSPSSCSRTPPRAQPRLSNRSGERPSGFHFKRCENNWRFFLIGSENVRAIEVNRSEPDWR